MIKATVCLLSAVMAVSVWADQTPVDYQVPVARLNGHLTCAVGVADNSFDCTVHVAGKGELNVDMKAAKNKQGEVVGYYGIDKLTEAGINYTMVVMADGNKAVQGVSMVTDMTTNKGTGFHAGLVSTAATSIQAVNVSPLTIDMSDPNVMNIDLGFSVYANPQSAIMTTKNSDDIIKLLLAKIQPYLLTLKK